MLESLVRLCASLGARCDVDGVTQPTDFPVELKWI